ncbi:MAG: WbqC family protein [Candidatus Cloacimonetes bacterium]|nr:WbqC family protein [Candidatus Cloacimonadota bacterium]
MSKVAIIQSNYLPWKGYFHIIQSVDHFVFLDSVKYTRRDWRNRNRIKTPTGCVWLTVPVHAHNKIPINAALIADDRWQRNHPKTLQQFYGKCPYFQKYFPLLEELYNRKWTKLSELNQTFIREISRLLGLTTHFYEDRQFITSLEKSRRLLDIVKALDADTYVTGPSASAYLQEDIYEQAGIKVEYFQYPEYPSYEQQWGNYISDVSILDLLFHQGTDSGKYIWGERQ